MGLSNYIPSSRISQAGVCTSTTRPASPYEGQVIYETDTNKTLWWDSSAWVGLTTNNISANNITAANGMFSNGVDISGGHFTTPSVSSAQFGDAAGNNYMRFRDIYGNFYLRVGAGNYYSDSANYYVRNASQVVNLEVQSDGGVRTPNQPVYQGRNSGGSITIQGIYKPNSTVLNVGNKWNISTGLFTPGFACRVLCSWNSLIGKPDNSYAWVSFLKNNLDYGNKIHTSFGSGGSYEPFNHTVVMDLGANDNASIYVSTYNGAYIYDVPWGGSLTFAVIG